jgi:hypothetical protein
MYKFYHDMPGDKFSVTLETDEVRITEILEHFKYFLSGCGFSQELTDKIQYIEDIEEWEGA